jgi:hypothetical protein
MTMRRMRPPEVDSARTRSGFDPVREGERYRLSRELSLAIWERVSTDATDSNGRCDTEQAERRFHELARIAARRGRWRPDVGRLTRVGSEITGVPMSAWRASELRPRAPGREPLVAAEARRWSALDEVPELDDAAAANAGTELPGAAEVTAALQALGQATPAPAVSPGHDDPRRPDLGRWSLEAQMRRTFGGAARGVAISADSTRPLAAGAEGVAIGEQVYIAPGYYDLTTTTGRERLGHEVAHVLQQRRGRDLRARITSRERAGLEAEADRAGHAFARGERFAVQGRAPAQVALFKGAAPAKATTTTTTIDLKAGGRIERKPPPEPAGDTAAPADKKPKDREELIVSYGGVQASRRFAVERDDSGNAIKLVGNATLSLPASTYVKQLDLKISLGPDGTVGAKLQGTSTQALKIGGLTVRGGNLTAAIDHGQLSYALDGVTIALPRNLGEGSLSIQGNGDQEPAFDASLTIHVPRLQPSTMSFHADARGYRAEGSAGVDVDKVSGNVNFSLEKVGDDRALWSAAGSVGYSSERLSGRVSVQYNADGELSGEGMLDFKIADFLTGTANVALDKDGHVTVNGEIRPPNETQLFPEKKLEQQFFRKSVEFPIWGISIPGVGSVGIIAFIEGSMGYRVGVGAGVMRDIVLSGSYSTDPNVQPTFQITGEIFIPAFAELIISIGGGVKLDAFVAEIGGGIKIGGRAGFYGGLSVRPTLAYEGGKYRLMGQAILAGDVGLSAELDAFIRLKVGKWFLSWEKQWDWKLGEWNKWLGLNLGMEADLDYTLGQPLSPDIFKLKKPDSLDVQGIAKSAMPKEGMPAQGPKGAQNQRNEFKLKAGGAAAPTTAPAQPKVAGTPAGAAGHKNQDPKGKTVKPARPPRSGPPQKAKGKGPHQTGPDPKNNSKPSEQKLDAKPIVESFSMHGEPHQLIVQLGPSGHVDMASRRERLSVKVGNAVGKLIAKRASPQQIADLKEIGALAKKGDRMVASAKMTDREGATRAARQIAAYGTRWEVHDLHEVAIKKPAKLEVAPVSLAKPPPELARVLVMARSGEVIFTKAGDPKEIARQVLEQHKDASFDFPSAKLTLPAPQAQPLMAAHSVDQLGKLLAQQTGVSKITIKKTENKGETRVELVGAIGVSATLGSALIKLEDWFGFKLGGSSGVIADDPRLQPEPGGSLLPHPIGEDKHKTAYLATIATAPANSERAEQRIVAPRRIGDVYSKAFDLKKEPHALQNRFALVIGVNKLDDLEGDAAAEVERNASAGVGHGYPWGILGFVWQHPWQQAAGGAVPVEQVRRHMATLTPELQAAVRHYRDDTKVRVPMGLIRDMIHQSGHTTSFARQLQDRAHRVFIQVGDGDVLSLNPPGEEMPYFNRYDRLIEEVAREIASHGKRTSSSGNHRPIIASGGYQLQLQINPGDGGTPDVRAKLASELDMKVRAAMAKVDPGLVYFPEPNLIIEITEDTFNLRFGDPDMESRVLARTAITRLSQRGHKADLLWDERATMVTTAPGRFAIGVGATMSRAWIEIDELSAEELQAMFEQAQSHASKRNWATQVHQSTGLPQGSEDKKLFFDLYDAAFPINWSDPDSYLPMKGLRAKLMSRQPDHAAIAELGKKLQDRLELQEQNWKGKGRSSLEPTANQDGGHKGVADRVCKAAVAAGEAVRQWLLGKLPPA